MKKTIDNNQKAHETQISEMRAKHTQQVEQYNEELENVRKVGAVITSKIIRKEEKHVLNIEAISE